MPTFLLTIVDFGRICRQRGTQWEHEEQEVIAISEANISVTAAQDHSFTTEAKDRDEIRHGGDWYKFVNVLWIGWTKDDKVYRKALGRIWLVSWEKISVEQVRLLLT